MRTRAGKLTNSDTARSGGPGRAFEDVSLRTWGQPAACPARVLWEGENKDCGRRGPRGPWGGKARNTALGGLQVRGHGKVEPEARSHTSPSSGGKRSQLFSGDFMNRKLIGRGWEGVPPPFCAESYATSARSLPRLGDAGAPRPQSFFHVPGAGLPEYAHWLSPPFLVETGL